jgi:mannose-6-phosphate isomerase
LGKQLGAGDDYAESWEVVDHGDDQSVVAHGELAGLALGKLREQFGVPLVGSDCDRFPLLFKLLDCHRNLSVQVHPNDEAAAQLDPPDLGKTEAWVVLEANPDSQIFAGLRDGVDRKELERAIESGETESCLHQFVAAPGDCVFIPAGVVHALGGGLVIAEIQQSSDTTYRLFDWNRTDSDGQPRPLHVADALEVIDFEYGPVNPQQPAATDRSFASRLVSCDKFVLDRCTFGEPVEFGGDGQFRILSTIEGQVELSGDPSLAPLGRGQTALIPASCSTVATPVDGPAMLLEMSGKLA